MECCVFSFSGVRNIKTILHIFRTYTRDQSLPNDIVLSCNGTFRNVVCYLIGQDDGNNRMAGVADEVIYLDLDRKAASWSNSASLSAVSGVIDNRAVDIVACHMWRAIPIGVFASGRSQRKPKTVGVFHGVKKRVNPRVKLLYYFLMRRLDRIVSVSEGGLEDISALFWKVDPGKMVAVPNGLDFTGYESAEAGDRKMLFGEGFEKRRVVITVSRLADKKNLERFLMAFSAVRREYPDIGLVIVGTGPNRAKLEAVVAEQSLSQEVVFLGYREDIPTLLKSADLYAIPSLREGLPRSLVEAMAVGKPVLASKINGHKEVVTDLEHGVLVDPWDVVDIAAGLKYLISMDEKALKSLGEAAQEQALTNFNRDVMMAKYLRLFTGLA
jgi:glycosyltransferase involved in cell wall biosynthesis